MLSFRGSPHGAETRRVWWVIVAAIVSTCPPALAQGQSVASVSPSGASEDVAHAKISLALSKYESGEYRAAAELFLEAHKSVPEANLLYNAARCYERLGENRRAIVRYQQFIEAPDSDEGGKARANAALQRLEQAEFLALRKGPDDTDGPTEALESVATDSNNCQCQNGLPWYLLGVGTVAVGAGTWTFLSGLERERQVTTDPAFDDPARVHALTRGRSENLLASSERRKAWGVVGLGVGGALMATAIMWLILEPGSQARPESRASYLHVDVGAGEDRGGIVVGGWF
jgi:tetratricopeptide (TPR) repeat protein